MYNLEYVNSVLYALISSIVGVDCVTPYKCLIRISTVIVYIISTLTGRLLIYMDSCKRPSAIEAVSVRPDNDDFAIPSYSVFAPPIFTSARAFYNNHSVVFITLLLYHRFFHLSICLLNRLHFVYNFKSSLAYPSSVV